MNGEKNSPKCKITSGTKEWADHNVNCIEGCYNDCRYCYAKIMAKRFGRKKEEDWKNMKIRKEMLDKNFKKMSGRVMFPSTHDIIDISPFMESCFVILEKLLEAGNSVLVTTKPRLKVIREIVKQFNDYRDNIQFRFTITSRDDRLLEFWEPNAPSFNERFASLRYAFQEEFKTSVSIEPFLDNDPTKLITELTPFVTESIWVGRMNYIARQNLSEKESLYYNEIRRNYTTRHIWNICDKLRKNPKIRLKDSILLQISRHLGKDLQSSKHTSNLLSTTKLTCFNHKL